jgi:hypothetical protein
MRRLLGSLVQRRRRNSHLLQLAPLGIGDRTHLVRHDPKLRRSAAHSPNGLGRLRRSRLRKLRHERRSRHDAPPH